MSVVLFPREFLTLEPAYYMGYRSLGTPLHPLGLPLSLKTTFIPQGPLHLLGILLSHMILLIHVTLLALETCLIPREPIYPTRSNLSLWTQIIPRNPLYSLEIPSSHMIPLFLVTLLTHGTFLIPWEPTYRTRPNLSLWTLPIPRDPLYPSAPPLSLDTSSIP